MILRQQDIDQGLTGGVGIKYLQALILGLNLPLEKGWKKQCIGKVISDEDYAKFLSYRDVTPRPKDKKKKAKQLMLENTVDLHTQQIIELENQIAALFRLLSNTDTCEIPLYESCKVLS